MPSTPSIALLELVSRPERRNTYVNGYSDSIGSTGNSDKQLIDGGCHLDEGPVLSERQLGDEVERLYA